MKTICMHQLAKDIEEKGCMIKVSGRALGSTSGAPYSQSASHIIDEIISLYNLLAKPKIAVVLGGGNIWRGYYGKEFDIEGPASDEMGIYATITNELMVRNLLIKQLGSDKVELMMPFTDNISETYSRKEAKKAMNEGKILVIGGGLGATGMSTDFAAVNRAIGLELGAVLMAKDGVDGVYDRRPEEPGARKYKLLNYKDFIAQELKIADSAAVCIAKERSMPMMFFDFSMKGAFGKILVGEDFGTYVGNVPTTFD